MLLEDVLNEFMLELELQNYSDRTIKSYRNNNYLSFTYFKQEFNVTKIEQVKPIHLKSYIKFLQKKGSKSTYINGIIKTFRAYFKYATLEEYITVNPTIKVGWVKEDKALIKAFTDEEVSRMIDVYKVSDYMTIRNKCIMALLLDTGIRNSELCKLVNVDVNELSLTIKQGKGRKDRRVSLSPYLRKVILRYVRCRDTFFFNRIIDKDTPFFMSYRFKKLTPEAIERIVKLCGEKADIRKDIRCSPHTCRHYFAQAQLRNGLDVYSLSRLLGHENITITKRYLQSIEDADIVELSVKTSPLMNLKRNNRGN